MKPNLYWQCPRLALANEPRCRACPRDRVCLAQADATARRIPIWRLTDKRLARWGKAKTAGAKRPRAKKADPPPPPPPKVYWNNGTTGQELTCCLRRESAGLDVVPDGGAIDCATECPAAKGCRLRPREARRAG